MLGLSILSAEFVWVRCWFRRQERQRTWL
ncbi:MAG: hypothetical protein JO121_27485 [Deltaproteobacteria bacterium]|nr:hypothetical protein [Deltaproteobacteria bacterium]